MYDFVGMKCVTPKIKCYVMYCALNSVKLLYYSKINNNNNNNNNNHGRYVGNQRVEQEKNRALCHPHLFPIGVAR